MTIAGTQGNDAVTGRLERPPSIELRAITKRFGEFVAVNGISLAVQPGEFVTLLGPSGCGKTTTLRMIGGFEYPTSGSLLIHGEEMANRPPHKRPVNTVFQNYALFPHMTVGDNVAYGLVMAGVPKKERNQRVGAALEMVRLPQVEHRKPAELSGGQQQRVALARALINRPEVLLLDEPLGALDLKLRKAMQLELKGLNREVGATFVYVTHDQEEALTMSDRIAVMSEGRILQIGAPDDIYERPRSRFVADFIGQTNFLTGHLTTVADGFGTVAIDGGIVRAQMPDGESLAGEVTVAVRPEKISLRQDLPGGGLPSGWNALTGVVSDVIYLGTHTQYVVRLPDGQTAVVHRQNRVAEAPLERIGDTAQIAFDPRNAAILVG